LAPVFYIDSTLYDSPYLFWKILGGKQGQNFQKMNGYCAYKF
jgi:hypothetical protein